MIRSLTFGLIGLTLVTGCTLPEANGRVSPHADASVIYLGTDGLCYGKDVSPAVIETVTEQVLVQPAVIDSNGLMRSPAAYRTVTRQQILRERREIEFEAVCPTDLTPDFIATLQRALQARGGFAGHISGQMDRQTERALRRWQAQQRGPNSAILSIAIARDLGLIALSDAQLNE